MPKFDDILHDIVKLLPHRQEVLDDLHDRIDQAAGGDQAPAEVGGPGDVTPPAVTEGAPPA